MGLISPTNQSNFQVDIKFLEKRISFPTLRLLQESFSSLAGTSIGRQKIQPFLPQSNRRIKKGETEEKASYFLLSARKSSLLCKITRKVLSLHKHVLVAQNNLPPFPPIQCLPVYARFVRLFFLARYDIPFWSLRAQQNLVLCAKQPKSTGVQNTSVDKNNTHIDHGTDSEATPAYRLQAPPPSAAVDGSNMRPNQPTTFWQDVTPAPVPTL
jgi:hypothetical protein